MREQTVRDANGTPKTDVSGRRFTLECRELTKEGASQDVAGGLDGRMEMVLVDVVIGWRLSVNLEERASFQAAPRRQ